MGFKSGQVFAGFNSQPSTDTVIIGGNRDSEGRDKQGSQEQRKVLGHFPSNSQVTTPQRAKIAELHIRKVVVVVNKEGKAKKKKSKVRDNAKAFGGNRCLSFALLSLFRGEDQPILNGLSPLPSI